MLRRSFSNLLSSVRTASPQRRPSVSSSSPESPSALSRSVSFSSVSQQLLRGAVGIYQLHNENPAKWFADSVTFSATEIRSGNLVHIKRRLITLKESADKLECDREVIILRTVAMTTDHPASILHLIEYYVSILQPENQNLGLLSFVFEKLPGLPLSTCLETVSAATILHQIPSIVTGVATALAYIHSLRIMHRDISPACLYWNEATSTVKIVDFSYAKSTDNGPSGSAVGNVQYRAPELLLDAHHYGTAVDMWSLGCVIAELLLCASVVANSSGHHASCWHNLISASTVSEAFLAVIQLLGTPTQNQLKQMNPTASVLELPQVTPGNLTLRFKSFMSSQPALGDLLKQLLCYDPQARLLAAQVLKHPFLVTSKT